MKGKICIVILHYNKFYNSKFGDEFSNSELYCLWLEKIKHYYSEKRNCEQSNFDNLHSLRHFGIVNAVILYCEFCDSLVAHKKLFNLNYSFLTKCLKDLGIMEIPFFWRITSVNPFMHSVAVWPHEALYVQKEIMHERVKLPKTEEIHCLD